MFRQTSFIALCETNAKGKDYMVYPYASNDHAHLFKNAKKFSDEVKLSFKVMKE